jgi:hypothetical protein
VGVRAPNGAWPMKGNKATGIQSPWLKLYEESDSKERLSVSNWIVHRLYDDAVKEIVEL